MMKTKFTKGKWSPCEIGDNVWIDDEQGFSIAQVYDCEGVTDNAHLIAAAPDMYELLERIGKEEKVWSIREIHELLAKARGDNNE